MRLKLLLLLFVFGLGKSESYGQTAYVMSGGDYTENFNDIPNTTNWPNGFGGPSSGEWKDVAVSAGSIPGPTAITVATSAFVTMTTAGVQRGTDNIQLLTTGATDNTSAAAIDLFLNFSGRQAGTLSFDAAMVANSTGNRAGTLRVYASTDGVSFTEITSTGLPYTATNNVASAVTISGAALPAGFTNSATARLRFYYHNGTGGTTGSRPKISIDNILVTSTPVGIVTVANGDWYAGTTWSGGVVPTSAQTAIVAHAVTAAAPITRDAGTTTTVNTGASLSVASPYTNNGTTIVDGTFVTSTTGGVSIAGGSVFRINGTARIDSGGFFSNSPVYGNNSTLIYNSGATYGRGFEWSALGSGTIGTTAGYPNNVTITNSTILNYINGAAAGAVGAKAVAGNLTIDSGSALHMNFGGVAAGGALTVAGNLSVAGTLTLGASAGDDIKVGANVTVNGTFNGNNRAVYFTKNGTQTIASASTLTIPYVVYQPASGSTTVQLTNSDLIISAPLGGNALSFSSTGDIFDINGRTLTIGSAAIANTIFGSGTLKGSTTSNLTLLGTGSIGTLNFTTGFQNLGTLMINRTAATVAASLGTALTVNTSVALTSGNLNVGTNILSLSAAAIFSGGSANSFVIADGANAGAAVRKTFSASSSFTFPVGDDVASLNGSQYSPVSVSVGTGTFAAGNYIGVFVQDIKHPAYDANTDYITRYWDVATSGISGVSGFSATGTYLDVDIVGSEANFKGNRYNGTSWTNQGSLVNAAGNSFTMPGLAAGATNQITAGLRDQDINVILTSNSTTYLNGSIYNFGTQLTGSTTDITFTVQNLGERGLSITGSTLTGNPPYSITSALATGSLSGPTGTRTFTIRFAPTAAGTFSGSISIANDDPTGSEAPYVINFTGIGEVPAPEMNVRGLTGGTNSIVSGSITASGLNNTLFAATNIGSSATKDFQIQNLGTAVLTLTGSPIVSIGGSNPGDFAVTTIPASSSIAVSGSTSFVITFSPTMSGVRTAIVSIANNDSDENPYTFLIQGTGNCNATGNTISPLSGPVNTQITVTASTNTLTGATATINGIAATVIPVSSTQINVIVPAGATSGYLVTTNAQGCTASNYFTVIDNTIANCQGTSGSARTQLFISEVTDHPSGSHSYVEIFNATGAAVNLSGYSVRVHHNGSSTPTYTITLPSFSLANNTAYVVAFGGTDATSNPGGYTPNLTNTGSGINADDHIRLHNNSGTWIDLWGDPAGSTFTVSAAGYYYRRKNSGIIAPSTTWNPNDWNAAAPVEYSNIGVYDFSTGAPPTVVQHPSATPTCKSTSFTVAGVEGFTGGNPLAYQWYVLAPGATSWTAIVNGGVYSGAASATLNISNITGLNGYQYYAQIRENTATCFAASNAVMISDALTVTWNGTAWSPSPPTIGSIAVINGNYNTAISGSFEACSVTVNSGSTLTIGAGNYVSIQNDLTVSSSAVLYVADDASLVMIDNSGVVTNNGTMQIVKTTSPYNKFDYTYWSSPVANATIGATFPLWRTDYAFQFSTANYADVIAPFDGFDDDSNAWQNVGTGTVMTPGKGYAIMAPTTGTFPATSTVTFSGAVNNGIVSIPLAMSANAASTVDDFNLIGNPYPSAIYGNDFINANTNTSGTLYFWTHRTGISTSNPGPDTNNFITVDYAMYNLSGGTSSGPGSPAPTGYIASGQGFFVEAQAATPVVFNNSMRSKNYNNSLFYRSTNVATVDIPKDRVWLNMSNQGGLFSQVLVGYFDEATNGVDFGYDGSVNPASNSISFYSFIESDKYRIQGRSPFGADDVVNLGYTSAIAGSFSISLHMAEGVLGADETPVYIEDRLLNIIHDLKGGPFDFTTAMGAFDDRFLLRYTNATLDNPEVIVENNDVLAFAEDGQIVVKSASAEIHKITAYDMLGRTVFSYEDLSSEIFQTALLSRGGSLIIKVLLADGKLVTRKLIY